MSIKTQRINPFVLVCLTILFLVYLGTVFDAQVQFMDKIFLTAFFSLVFVSVTVYETIRIDEEDRNR